MKEFANHLNSLTSDLKKSLDDLHKPFSGMLDDEAEDEVERERNLDHAKDNLI